MEFKVHRVRGMVAKDAPIKSVHVKLTGPLDSLMTFFGAYPKGKVVLVDNFEIKESAENWYAPKITLSANWFPRLTWWVLGTDLSQPDLHYTAEGVHRIDLTTVYIDGAPYMPGYRRDNTGKFIKIA